MLIAFKNRSVAAVVSCYCFIIIAAVNVLWLGGALFLLFVLLYSQRVANHVRPYESCYITQVYLADMSSRNVYDSLVHEQKAVAGLAACRVPSSAWTKTNAAFC